MNNVVLITVDCLRADHIGCYGYNRPTTPNIDEFTEDAAVYEHGYSNCPGTRWAFQALQAGVYTHQIEGIGIPDTVETLAQQFQETGYATGAFSNNGFLSEQYDYDTGFETFHGVEHFHKGTPWYIKAGFRIRDVISNETFSQHVLRPVYRKLSSYTNNSESGGFKPANTDVDTVDLAAEWIQDQQSNDQPFFTWIHLMDAHDPYARWDNHLRALRGDTNVEHAINGDDYVEVGEEPPQALIDAYDSGIRSADEQIGRILSLVDDDTVVAITGDHGEEFGRYKPFHSASLYSSMTQVPIIIRSPDLPATRVQSHWAQHLDVPPTLLDAVGLSIPKTWEGNPLQQIDRELDDPIYFTVKDDLIGVRRGEWKLFNDDERRFELYNVPHSEPEIESTNDDNIKSELRQLIYKKQSYLSNNIVGETGNNLDKQKEDLSDEVRDSLKDLGYIESD